MTQLYYYQVRMEPLREVIGAHLCCGLSHIDPDIQRDALKGPDSTETILAGF